MKNRHQPKDSSFIITLVWDDKVRTRATVVKLAPEVVCGEARFKQDPRYPTVYHEIRPS